MLENGFFGQRGIVQFLKSTITIQLGMVVTFRVTRGATVPQAAVKFVHGTPMFIVAVNQVTLSWGEHANFTAIGGCLDSIGQVRG